MRIARPPSPSLTLSVGGYDFFHRNMPYEASQNAISDYPRDHRSFRRAYMTHAIRSLLNISISFTRLHYKSKTTAPQFTFHFHSESSVCNGDKLDQLINTFPTEGPRFCRTTDHTCGNSSGQSPCHAAIYIGSELPKHKSSNARVEPSTHCQEMLLSFKEPRSHSRPVRARVPKNEGKCPTMSDSRGWHSLRPSCFHHHASALVRKHLEPYHTMVSCINPIIPPDVFDRFRARLRESPFTTSHLLLITTKPSDCHTPVLDAWVRLWALPE